jgi:Cu/Ag efflux protein CusF
MALCLLVLAGGARLAWSQPGAAPRVDYRGTGVVQALLPPPSDLHKTRPVIVIFHDPVPGLMPDAMSMPFIAASTELFRDLHPGDRIAFGMQDTPDALLVVTIDRRR